MAIAAHLEETAGLPREPRRKLLLEAPGALSSGAETAVLIYNLSATGLLLECPIALAIGERIGIALPHAGANWANVVWVSGNFYGCQFGSPISAASLSAAQLRSAAEPELDVATRREPTADDAFGFRLQQLRKKIGLSQSDLAVKLGVSKPTVWAWEHGKAHPIASRLDSLAQALGVAKAVLMPELPTAALDLFIAKSRQQIAAAAGTTPGKVRIWIEL